jgi:hypothetical protein
MGPVAVVEQTGAYAIGFKKPDVLITKSPQGVTYGRDEDKLGWFPEFRKGNLDETDGRLDTADGVGCWTVDAN